MDTFTVLARLSWVWILAPTFLFFFLVKFLKALIFVIGTNFVFSQSEEDIERRRQKFRQNSEKFSETTFGRKISFGTQTDYRESDIQTEPCTIDYADDDVIRRNPEVTSLAMLRHGRGLPVKTNDDLVSFKRIRFYFYEVLFRCHSSTAVPQSTALEVVLSEIF